jgi:hypothetical protein
MKHLPKIVGMIVGILYAGLHSGSILAQTDLETHQVALSQKIKTGDRIGGIRFLGMLELPDVNRNDVRLSQLSGLAWDDDEGILYAISDKGGLFHLQPLFEGDVLTGIKLLRALPLRELGSDKPLRGWRIDSEGLDIVNGRNGRRHDAELLISLERVPQIMRYRPDGYAIGRHASSAPIKEAGLFRDPNKMLESVCLDSANGVLTMPETPLKNEHEGYNRIFSTAGASWLYPFAPGDRITAMECLGQGEVLVLQQNYKNPFRQIIVMLRRVRLPSVPTSESLNPETIVTLDSRDGYQIDNFEGLTRHRSKRFFMVSDNNDLFIQRTLLMYFELLDD